MIHLCIIYFEIKCLRSWKDRQAIGKISEVKVLRTTATFRAHPTFHVKSYELRYKTVFFNLPATVIVLEVIAADFCLGR